MKPFSDLRKSREESVTKARFRSLLSVTRRGLDRFHQWIISCSGSTTRRQRSRIRLRRGMQHMLKDEFFEAAVEYKAAVAEDPTDVYALINRGLAWLNLRDFEMAQADFETAIELDETNWYARFARGIVLNSLGNHLGAKEDFIAALALLKEGSREQRGQVLRERACCYLGIEDYTSALADAQEYIHLAPGAADGYAIRAAALHRMGQIAEALQNYSEAIRIGPASARYFAGRGHARSELDQWPAAIADLEQAVRLDPTDISNQCLLGYLLNVTGRWAQASQHYEQLLLSHPGDAQVMNNYAWLLSTCPEDCYRDGHRAMTLATEACLRSGWKVACYLGTLAAANAEIGDYARAVELATRAVELYNDDERRCWAEILDVFRAGRPYREQPQTSG